MGKKQTPEAFRNACNSFKYLDLIGNVSRQKDDKNFETAPSKTKINGQDKEVQNKETSPLGALVKQNEKDVKTDYAGDITPKERIKDEIDKIIDEQSDSEGWLLASSVGTLLQRLYSDFDCRIYGYKRFIDFLVEGLGYESKVSADKKVKVDFRRRISRFQQTIRLYDFFCFGAQSRNKTVLRRRRLAGNQPFCRFGYKLF